MNPRCAFCGSLQPVPTAPPDVRLALSEAFKDLADQALARGDREAHGIWNQAAAMAHDFVLRKRT